MAVLAELDLVGTTVALREAVEADLPAVVGLLADDPLGAVREVTTGAADEADMAPYRRAFAAVDRDPSHLLLVATAGTTVLATTQVVFLPGLSRRGALRAQVEAVRVAASHRSQGLGAAVLGWVVDEARRRGCALVQLSTDASRTDAHRFYERLGFAASHVGYKLVL